MRPGYAGAVLPLVVLGLIAPTLRAQEASYSPSSAEREVRTWRGEWHDASRGRTIPVKVYYPAEEDAQAAPVILFSHGLGGSRETYGYLGRCWAGHGYVSVHLQHPGSDTAVLAGARGPLEELQRLKHAARDTANFSDRPQDIRFALDRLTALVTDTAFPLAGRMDLDRIGAAGHSFGAYTVLALAGEAVGPDGAVRYYGPDPRITAGIAMSSAPALLADLDRAYDRITMPIFHMTGTKDEDPAVRLGTTDRWGHDAIIGVTTAAGRRVAYDHTRNAPAYLLTFRDGDHRVFAGVRGHVPGGEHDAAYQRIICAASTAFWDATLKQNAAARSWLEQGGLTAMLGDAGTFEQKHPQLSRSAR